MNSEYTKKQSFYFININNEFKKIYEFINKEDKLSEKIFNILDKYIKYDIAGLYFNESDESSLNVFNMSFPKKNIDLKIVDEVRDKFFDEIEKYKRINEIQCNLINGDIKDKSNIKISDMKEFEIKTYKNNKNITGGFFISSTKKFNKKELYILNLIKEELKILSKIKNIYNEQKRNSLKDNMTGLYNRQYFDEMLNLEFSKARRYIYNFSLAILDIDYLSKINKEFGIEFGDFVLKELSNLLKRVFRKTDPIFRYGNEEIIVYLPFTPITKAIIPIERLRSEISKYVFEKDNKKTNITVSIGICANYSKFTEPNQLLDGLGKALLDAKEGGRNKVGLFE